MVELERRITGEWIEMREAGGDLPGLDDRVRLTEAELREQAGRLKLAVEEGIVEHKQSVLRPVFTSLESMKYQTLPSTELDAYRRAMDALLFIIMAQKLLAAGTLPLGKTAAPAGIAAGKLDVQAILTDVRRRVQADSGLQKHPAIKNILLQFQLYQKEWEKMQELAPNIREENETTFKQNFRAVFQRTFESIRRHYAGFLQEKEAHRGREQPPLDLLRRLALKELVGPLLRQAQAISRIRSTLGYAAEERYKTREILVRVYERRRETLDLVELEMKKYRELCERAGQPDPDCCALAASARMRDELVRILEGIARSRQKTGE